jgi:hypothetical protein
MAAGQGQQGEAQGMGAMASEVTCTAPWWGDASQRGRRTDTFVHMS